jgi:hypothetical protein
VNPSDTFRFLLAVGLFPVFLRLGRGIRAPRGRRAFIVGVLAIVLAFGMQVFGSLTPWAPQVRLLRHFVFGFGGFSLAWAAWQARGYELAQAAGESR